MNKLSLLLIAPALVLASCGGGKARPAGTSDITSNEGTLNNPAAGKNQLLGNPVFEEEMYDFGKIKEGEIVKHRFVFKNTGKGPMSIASAVPGCGCTDPDWTRGVIPAGGEGFVSAAFNSDGKSGKNEKYIDVTFGTSSVGTKKLIFKADVTPKAK